MSSTNASKPLQIKYDILNEEASWICYSVRAFILGACTLQIDERCYFGSLKAL